MAGGSFCHKNIVYISHKLLTNFTLACTSKTHINGAAHQGASLTSLQHDAEQIGRGFTQVKELRHTPCKVNHGFTGAATLEGLIRAFQSGKQIQNNLLQNVLIIGNRKGPIQCRIYWFIITK